jgi:hypothetical protein
MRIEWDLDLDLDLDLDGDRGGQNLAAAPATS